VEVVDTFTYLGSQFHSSSGSEHEVNRRISISRNCMQIFDRHIWWSMISLSTKLRFYNAYTSGISVWSRDMVHNQRELMPSTNGVFGASWTLPGRSMWWITKSAAYWIATAIRHCADQTPQVVWSRGPGRQVSRSFPCSTSLHIARSKKLEAASRSSKTHLAEDGGGRSAPSQSWTRIRAQKGTER